MSLNKRYFDMLGAAYDVPNETARFEGFLDAAMAYFFDGAEDGFLAGDVPRHKGDDDTLDTHGQRVGALVEAASRRDGSTRYWMFRPAMGSFRVMPQPRS